MIFVKLFWIYIKLLFFRKNTFSYYFCSFFFCESAAKEKDKMVAMTSSNWDIQNLRITTLAHVLETICVKFHQNQASRLGSRAATDRHTDIDKEWGGSNKTPNEKLVWMGTPKSRVYIDWFSDASCYHFAKIQSVYNYIQSFSLTECIVIVGVRKM